MGTATPCLDRPRHSLLLYLNDRDDNWDLARDGGGLRLHLDPSWDVEQRSRNGGDAAVLGHNYEDVVPLASGTERWSCLPVTPSRTK